MHVLVIDDDRMILRCIARMLGREHAVVAVESAREASALLAIGESFDAIVCDLHLRGERAPCGAFVSTLAPRDAARVVFITGGAYAPGDAEALEGRSVLLKPFTQAALFAAVERANAGSGVWTIPPTWRALLTDMTPEMEVDLASERAARPCAGPATCATAALRTAGATLTECHTARADGRLCKACAELSEVADALGAGAPTVDLARVKARVPVAA